MKKIKKNIALKEECVLKIEVSDSSSELIMRLETIIKNDIDTQKLPKEFDILVNKVRDK
jgi:predicted phage-related endonuclease